jgi:prepilin-type N-terminal cleavage/methylation domain-containing protein
MLTAGTGLTTARRRPRPPDGFTLVELVLTLVLGALVLGLVTSVGTRLQHHLNHEGARLASGEQLAVAGAVLPPDLRALAPAAGDIRAGEARDTSLELRAIIGSALVCGGTTSSLIIAPYLGPFGRSSAPTMQTGDTLWLLVDSDSGESWRPVRLQAARRAVGSCSAITDAQGANAFDVTHLWSVELRDSVSLAVGAVVRDTRPVRYSLYRAGDSKWYLGARSWNSATSQFNLVQPISGPHGSPASGSRFAYFDSTGARLSSGTPDTQRIARIDVTLVAYATDASLTARDSLVIVVAPRNRR